MKTKVYWGSDMAPLIPVLARLRCSIFSEYPYLYIGDMDYEQRYLRLYATHPQALLVALHDDNGQIVGAASAMPLQADAHGPACKQVLEKAGYPVEQVFVYGESLLKPQYRGQGWGKVFFQERERAVRQCQNPQGKPYTWATFFAVIRHPQDPRRPQTYKDLDPLWNKQGFFKTDLKISIPWQEIGEAEESPKELAFWFKNLAS